MTNIISSTDEAREALMKLHGKSGALLSVEFSTDLIGFSLDGHIKSFDGEVLCIVARVFGLLPDGYKLPEITISGLRAWAFNGDFREDESGLFLSLFVTRAFDNCRVHIRAEWPETPDVGSMRIH